jgi:hypothetical protein
MDDYETALRFTALILGGEIVDGPPPEGCALFDLIRLSEACERGEITEHELQAGLERLHPPSPLDPGT